MSSSLAAKFVSVPKETKNSKDPALLFVQKNYNHSQLHSDHQHNRWRWTRRTGYGRGFPITRNRHILTNLTGISKPLAGLLFTIQARFKQRSVTFHNRTMSTSTCFISWVKARGGHKPASVCNSIPDSLHCVRRKKCTMFVTKGSNAALNSSNTRLDHNRGTAKPCRVFNSTNGYST